VKTTTHKAHPNRIDAYYKKERPVRPPLAAGDEELLISAGVPSGHVRNPPVVVRIGRQPPAPYKHSMDSAMKFPSGPKGISGNEVAHLAQSFHVSQEVVLDVYGAQYRRLAEGARIRQYVGLLAFKNTRQALHEIAAPNRMPSYPPG
jgi:hypothetical protein